MHEVHHEVHTERTYSVEQLKAEIARLNDEQSKDFGNAIYLGMTAELAWQCDERRKRIRALIEELVERCLPSTGSDKAVSSRQDASPTLRAPANDQSLGEAPPSSTPT